VPRLGHDHGAHPLAGALIGQADHRDVGDQRMATQNVLDLRGRDVLRVADDDVLQPPGDAHVAAGVDLAQVAGAKPPLVVERRAIVGRVDVTQEALRALEPQLTVGHPDLDPRAGPADGLRQHAGRVIVRR